MCEALRAGATQRRGDGFYDAQPFDGLRSQESHLQMCDSRLNFLCCEVRRSLRAPPDGLEDQGVESRP